MFRHNSGKIRRPSPYSSHEIQLKNPAQLYTEQALDDSERWRKKGRLSREPEDSRDDMVVCSLVFFSLLHPRLGTEDRDNSETPVGANKKSLHKSPLSPAKAPERGSLVRQNFHTTNVHSGQHCKRTVAPPSPTAAKAEATLPS